VIEHRFIASGAFQALNATEARHHYGLDDTRCELVYLLPPQPQAARQSRALIDDTGWSNVRVVGPPSDSFPHWVRRVRNGKGLRRESSSLSHLFLGDYQTHLALNAAHGVEEPDQTEVVVLDDGQATLRVNAHRVARHDGRRPPRLHAQVPRPRYDLQRVAARVLGLRIGDLDRITFFTLYDVRPAPTDRVVRNRFSWLRARFGAPRVVDCTLYLGTPLVESGMVAHDTYVTLLRQVRARCGGELRYRPHPREDPAHVAQLVDEAGVELVDLPSIIEYGLLASGWCPARVVSTHSSALDTLRVILGDAATVQSVDVPAALVAPRWRAWMTRSYEEMDARLGVPVERLELL
jgi:hypothetical protein